MKQSVWRGVQALPLVGALALLRWLPTLAQPSGLDGQQAAIRGVLFLPWRVDALTLVLLLVLTLGVALVPLRPRDTLRALAALALISIGLIFEHLLALPLTLIGVGLLLYPQSTWRWLLAAGLLISGLSLLYRNGGAGWYTPETATALRSPSFLLLLLAAYIGLNGYPLAQLHSQQISSRTALDLALQPIWLLPLLRTIGWGPWNSGWALATLLLGGALALWSATGALWTTTPEQRVMRIAGAWLGLAFICIGLLTPVGIASTLWQLLAYPIGLGLLLHRAATPSRWRIWAAPLPLSAAFIASWLAQGATAASGTFLLTALCWLVAIMSGVATIRLSDETLALPRSDVPGKIAAGLSLALGVLAPLPLRWLIVPAIDPLQGGLTPFGLLDIWPWIGLAALDSGQRRVAVLPSIALAVLALVVAALVWLLSRLLDRRRRTGEDETAGAADADGDWWAQLQQHVWWAKGARRRG